MSKSINPNGGGRNSNLLLRTTQQPGRQEVAKEKEVNVPKSCQAAVTPTKGHRFIDRYKGSPLEKELTQYRMPRVVKGISAWYVEYYFRIPESLRPEYKNRQWERFRVKEGIGIHRTDEYANLLLKAVRDALMAGFSPFMEEARFVKEEADELREPGTKDWNCQDAVIFFNSKWSERGNNAKSMAKMERTTNRFLAWLTARNFHHQSIRKITTDHVEAYLYEMKKGPEPAKGKERKSWTGKTFNNEKGFLSTMFNFFVKKALLKKNPVLDIDKMRVVNKKHKYYDDDQFLLIRDTLEVEDPTCFFAAKLIYYLCIRSEKELSLLRLSHFDLANKRVNLPAENTKTQTDRAIPLADELIPLIAELKKTYPGSHYVISVKRKSVFDLNNPPGATPFASGFLSRRFAKIRVKLKLSSDHTLYGFKHTRMLHLKNATNERGEKLSDGDMMLLSGHEDYTAFAQYMRDLALTGDPAKINRLSRIF